MLALLTMTSIEPPAVKEALGSGAAALVLGRSSDGASDPATIAALVEAAGLRMPRAALFVRFGPVDEPGIEDDLAGFAHWTPDAVVLPVSHGRDVAHLGSRLAVHEAEAGLPDGAIRIVATIGSAAGALAASSLVGASRRLVAIGWDADALSHDLSIRSDHAGEWAGPLAQVRATARLAAAAAGVPAFEAACAGGGCEFEKHLAAARRDGFAGMLISEPSQAFPVRA